MSLGYFEKRRIRKFVKSLPLEKRKKLLERLKTHCIHNVPFNSDIPCLKCMSESVRTGNIAQIARFL